MDIFLPETVLELGFNFVPSCRKTVEEEEQEEEEKEEEQGEKEEEKDSL